MTLDPKATITRFVDQAGSQAEAARQLGVTRSYICDLLAGRRTPGPQLLTKLGLRRTIRREVSYSKL